MRAPRGPSLLISLCVSVARTLHAIIARSTMENQSAAMDLRLLSAESLSFKSPSRETVAYEHNPGQRLAGREA